MGFDGGSCGFGGRLAGFEVCADGGGSGGGGGGGGVGIIWRLRFMGGVLCRGVGRYDVDAAAHEV